MLWQKCVPVGHAVKQIKKLASNPADSPVLLAGFNKIKYVYRQPMHRRCSACQKGGTGRGVIFLNCGFVFVLSTTTAISAVAFMLTPLSYFHHPL